MHLGVLTRFPKARENPAPGYRGHTSGALGHVGYEGYSWSSIARGTNGMYLGFNVTWLSSGNEVSRAYDFQLRCLSE